MQGCKVESRKQVNANSINARVDPLLSLKSLSQLQYLSLQRCELILASAEVFQALPASLEVRACWSATTACMLLHHLLATLLLLLHHPCLACRLSNVKSGKLASGRCTPATSRFTLCYCPSRKST